MKIEDIVLETIKDFIAGSMLFTALDVSNKVKVQMPFARHREVRDIVRAMFHSEIEPLGYIRTPITVTLSDGTTAEALLYHSISDSWDLDNKYSTQSRTQKASHISNMTVAVPVQSVVPPAIPAVAQAVAVQTAPTPAQIIATSPNARSAWDALFKTQPSLFPRS